MELRRSAVTVRQYDGSPMATTDRAGSAGQSGASSTALPSLAVVVSDFPAPSQTFIRRKIEGLRDAGVDVEVAATNFHSGADASGFPLISTAPWHHPGELRTARGRDEWRSMLRTIVSQGVPAPGDLRRRVLHAPLGAVRADIVHFEFSGIAVTYLDALDELRRGSRLAVSCRGAAEQIEPLKDPRRGAALAEVFSKMDLIHCVSDDMRRTVEQLGAPPDRILVNRPAVPVADFSPLRRNSPLGLPLRVLSIGRLHWKKGLDDGLRAVAGLRDLGIEVRYRIAGEGAEREKLTFLIDQLGLGDSAELLGTCAEARVRSELAEADVVLLPSLSEGISNSVLEAMAAGRPVITTDCGGMTEVVDHRRNGLVVPVGDVAAMTEHLAALASDPALWSRLASSAAATADEQLDVGRQVQRFVDAYCSLFD